MITIMIIIYKNTDDYRPILVITKYMYMTIYHASENDT